MDSPSVHVPGITVLPSPSPAYLSTTPKSAVHGYRAYESLPSHQAPPLEPLIVFMPTSRHITDRSVNGFFQHPVSLWNSLLIQ